MYRVGELDQKINFLREVRERDGIGGSKISTKKIASKVWCKVKNMSGKEISDYDKNTEIEQVKFVTRYRTDIKASDRIEFCGEQYNIISAPKTSKRYLYSEFIAVRGVAQ